MKFKPGVRIEGVQPEIVLAITVVNDLFKRNGQELVVTSVKDGRHSTNSLHYSGKAIDIRIWDIQDLVKFCDDLREALTTEFDVVLEKDHIHLEFDPKGG